MCSNLHNPTLRKEGKRTLGTGEAGAGEEAGGGGAGRIGPGPRLARQHGGTGTRRSGFEPSSRNSRSSAKGEAMQDAGYGLPRTPLVPRAWVNSTAADALPPPWG